jgi:FdhD protein
VRRRDAVTVEEPLEIRIRWSDGNESVQRSVSVTMRTPGEDFELAAGFLVTEGFLRGPQEVREIAYCGEESPADRNIVTVHLRPGVSFDPALINRNFYVTSSCGVCGKGSLEAIEIRGACPFTSDGPRVDPSTLVSLPDLLRASQPQFHRTGGLHAAGLFGPDGSLELLREDVGRHNAVDKVVGHGFLQGLLPLEERILMVSGRTSFEIVQKALAAGICFVASVGAPSSLAIDLAREFGMTLAGFVRDGGFNLYAHPERVSGTKSESGIAVS